MWKKATINKYVLCFIMMFPLVIPEGIAVLSNGLYSVVYRYGRLLSFAIILLLFFAKLKHGILAIPIQLKLSFVLALYCLVVTCFRGHSISDWLSVFAPCIFAGLIVESQKKEINILINSLQYILEFWIYINLFFMFFYPNGMYVSQTIGYTKNWILGYKSSFQYLLFPAVVLGWVQSTYSRKKLRFWTLLVTCIVESFLSGNAMLTVALIIVAVCYMFRIVEVRKFFNPFIYSMVILIINGIFIFGLTSLVNSKFGTMFLDYYGKSTTLGGRSSYIWPTTIQRITESPVVGYGIWSSDERRALYYNKPAAIHAHNQILEMLFVGGVIFLAIYMIFHVLMYKKAKDSKNLPSTRIVLFGLFIFYCMMSVEVFMRYTAFSIWTIIYLGFITVEIDKRYIDLYKTQSEKNNC